MVRKDGPELNDFQASSTGIHSEPPRTNPPQNNHAGSSNRRRHEFLASDGAPIGVVPLQPSASRPVPPETGTSFRPSENAMPNQGFTFDSGNMEAMGEFLKETLRQMGVSGAAVTKPRKRPSRNSRSQGIKAQQVSMSREADMSWKVKCR